MSRLTKVYIRWERLHLESRFSNIFFLDGPVAHAVGFCIVQSWLSEWVPQVRFSVVLKCIKNSTNTLTGLQIISADLRNHGNSFHSDVMNYDSMANDVINLINDLHLKKVILVGHSMGGKVAMAVTMMQVSAWFFIFGLQTIDCAIFYCAHIGNKIYPREIAIKSK